MLGWPFSKEKELMPVIITKIDDSFSFQYYYFKDIEEEKCKSQKEPKSIAHFVNRIIRNLRLKKD